MTAFKRLMQRMRSCRSGNAMLIVAAGMPALIGGAGFAVDVTQWYMWKGELQFAVDQAALAGAYARTSDETEATYETRAQQEFSINLDRTRNLSEATDPVAIVALEDWGTGEDNSVVVTASVTHSLPFSSFLTGEAATIQVSAQAAFEEGENFTSCLYAVDEDAEGAVTIGGSAEFIAGCGIAALSDDPEAIKVNGSPTIEAGWLLARGGIDDWFDANTDDVVRENMDGLYDPFGCDEDGLGACLTPPTNDTPREYSCPKSKDATSAYMADSVTTRTEISYKYYKKSGNNYTLQVGYSGTGYKQNSDQTTTATNVTLTALPASTVVVTGPSAGNYDVVAGSGNNRIYEQATTKVTTTYVNARLVEDAAVSGTAVLQPGTYADLTLKCDTVFTGGIYVIDGGMLEIHAQHDVTGAGVMFVLKNGAGIVINGGANVNLTAMTVPQLEAAGMSNVQAQKLAGMLIFEDPDSEGNSGNKLNGNSSTILNGTVYLPVSNLDIRGSAGVTAQCLMLVASTITLSGNVEMTSFCPADVEEDTLVSSTKDRVRLVS
ncbi:TadE/TadG family type IV pilus assembly protein [Tsuneonella sp. HG249]